jgi:hypothetical protein
MRPARCHRRRRRRRVECGSEFLLRVREIMFASASQEIALSRDCRERETFIRGDRAIANNEIG